MTRKQTTKNCASSIEHVGQRLWQAVICGVVTCVAVVLQAFGQKTQDYWLVGATSNNTYLEFVDAASILSLRGDVRRAWDWTFNSRGASKHPGWHFVSFSEYDCKARQVRILQLSLYDSKSQPQDQVAATEAPPGHYAVPGTVGEDALEFVCSNASGRTAWGSRIPPGMTLEDAASLLLDTH